MDDVFTIGDKLATGKYNNEKYDDMTQQFQNLEVQSIFETFPENKRSRLLKMRDKIFNIAAADQKIGAIEEVLKWGQPAYLTSQTGTGTTIRLAVAKSGDIGIYVHCQTSLIADFKLLFEDQFQFDGNRAILLDPDEDLNFEALKIFIQNALTYHLK